MGQQKLSKPAKWWMIKKKKKSLCSDTLLAGFGLLWFFSVPEILIIARHKRFIWVIWHSMRKSTWKKTLSINPRPCSVYMHIVTHLSTSVCLIIIYYIHKLDFTKCVYWKTLIVGSMKTASWLVWNTEAFVFWYIQDWCVII